MNKLKEFAGRHPLGCAFLSVLLLVLLMGGTAAIVASFGTYEIIAVESQVIGQIVATVAFLLLLWRLEWLAPAGISRPGSRNIWLATALILTYTGLSALFGFFGTLDVDLSLEKEIVPMLAHTTLAGVVEEILFRGLILYVLARGWGGSRWGIARAVLTSAFLFGVLHFFNLASGPADVTALQVTEAFLSAILYGALVLTGGSLWPAVVLHSAINLLVNLAAANEPGFEVTARQYLTFLLLELPTIVYGFYLLARIDPCPVTPAAPATVETVSATS